MRIACVGGARPNFMKLKPVVDALDKQGADAVLIHTGQHYDDRMSRVFFDELGMRPPDHSLRVGSGSQAEQTAKVMLAFEPILEKSRPDAVVVVGDVNSTMACAIVAAKAGPLVAHVESGLRSRDWDMPEEVNRVVTDRVSDYLLAPSLDAVDNLRAEGYREDQVHLVGNVMVDTLLSNLDRAMERPVLTDLGLKQDSYGLVTLHRPATVDEPAMLSQVLRGLASVAEILPLVFPVHPRTRARLKGQETSKGLRLIGPVGYLDFIALEANARLVLTDSGGVQEETTVLGVPCLTLRDNTERPITVTEGTNTLVGRDPEVITRHAARALCEGVTPRRPELWDGRAGERVAAILLSTPTGFRPTDGTQAPAIIGEFRT